MDVIALHQAGIENAVAPLGTALTENQMELLWKMTPQPLLCFDATVPASARPSGRSISRCRTSGRIARCGLRCCPTARIGRPRQAGGPCALRRVMAGARSLSDMVWTREVGSGTFRDAGGTCGPGGTA